ncbi:MAG: metallopeptidase family protein [Polyangiaceae bacterium]|nr:metallopeptidase family protein [Polyangiaceae bacterium]
MHDSHPDTATRDAILDAFLDRFDALMDGQPESALELALDPPAEIANEPDVKLAHATALWEVEGPEAARQQLEDVVAEDPDFADAHYMLWSLAEEGEDVPETVRRGLRVLELDRAADEEAGPPPPEDEEFLIGAAEAVLSSLPEPFHGKLAHVPIMLEPRPDEDVVRDGLDPRALGLFEGPTSEEMSSPDAYPAPTRIVLYSHCLLEAFGDNDQTLRDEVEITLLHEIGHHFRLDEKALERLGLD